VASGPEQCTFSSPNHLLTIDVLPIQLKKWFWSDLVVHDNRVPTLASLSASSSTAGCRNALAIGGLSSYAWG
jgi:hypothetical protein